MGRRLLLYGLGLLTWVGMLTSGCVPSHTPRTVNDTPKKPAPAITITPASKVRIVLAKTPSATAKFAAEELRSSLEKSLGCKASIQDDEGEVASDDGTVWFFVGPSRHTAALAIDTLLPEHFRMKTEGNCIYLVGRDDELDPCAERLAGLYFPAKTATLYAVQMFLNRYAGFRWLWPGEEGTIIPRQSAIKVPALDQTEGPAAPIRVTYYGFGNFYTVKDRTELFLWARRNGMGSSLRGDPRHSETMVVGDQYFDAHPEYYALVKGKRKHLHQYGKLCHSNTNLPRIYADWAEKTTEWDVVPVSANDGRGWCECPECTALDGPDRIAPSGNPITSGRMFTFANRVARELTRRGIRKPVYIYAYADYVEVPATVERIEDNVVVFIAHGLQWNRSAATAEKFTQLVSQWKAKASCLALRDYVDNGCPMAVSPFPKLDYRYTKYLFENVRSFQGIDFSGDASRDYALSGPTAYVYAKLLWNPDQKLEDILDEYYLSGWPGSHARIRAYFEYFEERVNRICNKRRREFRRYGAHDVDLMPELYSPEALARGSEFLDAAMTEALDDAERKRVEFVRIGLEATRLDTSYWAALMGLAEMGEELVNIPAPFPSEVSLAERQKRIKTAVDAMNVRQDFLDRHADTQAIPSAIFHSNPKRMTGMWDDVVRRLAELELSDNKDVILLRDPWKFRLDPANKGKDERWFAPQTNDSEWASIRVNTFWEKQGYGEEKYPDNKSEGYNGWAWYRTWVDLPAKDGIAKALLTLGAVDESYDLYLNGEQVVSFRYDPKANPGSWSQPQVIDITAKSRWGERNLVAVAVLDQAGMGGIWQPCTITLARPNLVPEAITSWPSPKNMATATRSVDGKEREVIAVSADALPVSATIQVKGIAGGENYRFSMRCRLLEFTPALKSEHGNWISVRVYFKDEAGKSLPLATYINFGIPLAKEIKPDLWLPLTRTFCAPPGASQAVITVYLQMAGIYALEDVRLCEAGGIKATE